jgi:hypothetical protein
VNNLDLGYNTFCNLPNLPLNIIKYLVANNDDLWKILNSSSADCLNDSNLTEAQKLSMIWNGIDPHSENYNVFMDSMSTDDLFPENVTMLRVFPVYINPSNRILSQVDIGFEVLCHIKIPMLSNYQPRTLRLLTEVLSTLNGADIGGIGLLGFENQGGIRSNKAQYNQYNGKSYKGYSAILSTRVG